MLTAVGEGGEEGSNNLNFDSTRLKGGDRRFRHRCPTKFERMLKQILKPFCPGRNKKPSIFYFYNECKILARSLVNFLLSINGQTHKFIIYAKMT